MNKKIMFKYMCIYAYIGAGSRNKDKLKHD